MTQQSGNKLNSDNDDPDNDPPSGGRPPHLAVQEHLGALEKDHPGVTDALRDLNDGMDLKAWAESCGTTQKALKPLIKGLEHVGLVIAESRRETVTKKDGTQGEKPVKRFYRAPAPAESDPRYIYLPEDLSRVIAKIEAFEGRVALDLETAGTNPIQDDVRLISIGIGNNDAYCVDAIRVDAAPLVKALERKPLICHNAFFEASFLRHHYGFSPPEDIEDTQDLSRVVHAGDWNEAVDGEGNEYCATFSHSLDDVIERELEITLPTEKAKYQKGHNWQRHKILHVGHIEYAAGDVIHLNDVAEKLYERGQKLGLERTLELEKRVRPAFTSPEGLISGIPVDVEEWQRVIAKKEEEVESLRLALEKIAPPPPEGKWWVWNGSRKDLDNHPHAAFRAVGVELEDLTEDTRKEAYEETGNEFLGAFNDYKEAASELSKNRGYLSGRVKDGRLYPSWDQNGTETGRISCSDPNGQNMPSSGPYRSLIRAEEGQLFVDGDLSQIELRCLGDLTKDPVMRATFLDPKRDLHRELAEAIVGHPVDKESPLRTGAKRINFGLSYGLGQHALVNILKRYFEVPDDKLKEKAEEVTKLVLDRYPGVREWMAEEKRRAKKGDRETRTRIGRRRVLKDYYTHYADDWEVKPSERFASPIQGTAADICKLALAKLYEAIRGTDTKIVLAVHDQITLEVPEGEAEEYKVLLERVLYEATNEILVDTAFAAGEVAEVKVKRDWSKT